MSMQETPGERPLPVPAEQPPATLTQRFFREVRQVNLGEQEEIRMTTDDLAEIAGDVSSLTEFCRAFEVFSQDPDAKLLIIDILRKLTVSQEAAVMRYDESIAVVQTDTLQKVCGGAAIGGTGALLYGAVAAGTIPVIGPALLAIGGLIGLSACFYGRLRLARQGRSHYEAKALRATGRALILFLLSRREGEMLNFSYDYVDRILVLLGLIVAVWSITMVYIIVKHVERREGKKMNSILRSAKLAIKSHSKL